MILLQIVFWICASLLIYSYLLYPLILKYRTRNIQPNKIMYLSTDELPEVALLLAAYNEETVIRVKVENAFDTDYPKEKFQVWVGSDCSSDGTDAILEELNKKYANLKFIPFKERTGKSQILNVMQAQCPAEILVFTDATTMYQHDTIPKLVRHFKNEKIGLVCGNFVTYQKKTNNIIQQEAQYLKRENAIKYMEGLLGCVIGSFGPVFALRKKLYTHIPPGFMMDDFFLTLGVMDKGFKAIMDKDALALEELDTDLMQEYKRKRRFSIGNFRNHAYFKSFHNPLASVRNWCYISHKYLRWLGPFFIMAILFSCGILSFKYTFYSSAAGLILLLLFIALVDFALLKSNIKSNPFRFILYFIVANLALLEGYFKYRSDKIRTSTWKPGNR